MPKDTFFRLDEDKQAEILRAARTEFVEQGFRNASTNSMVKAAGISKGSLFYYFDGKDDLFVYLVERASEALTARIEARAADWPRDILQRLRRITEVGLDLLLESPDDYHLLTSLMDAEAAQLRERYMREKSRESMDLFSRWLEDIDTDALRFDLATTQRLIAWLYAGMKFELAYLRPRLAGPQEAQAFREAFLSRLDVVIAALGPAIYKEGSND